MSAILIVIPVLNRPHRAAKVVDSIRRSTDVPYRIAFVCTIGDHDQIQVSYAALGDGFTDGDDLVLQILPNDRGDYAKKINTAYREIDADDEHDYVFLGADDLEFQDGWASEALRVAEETGAGVVGTNDLANSMVTAGLHSTHSLVRRSYIDECGGYVGGQGKVYFEGYRHNQVDVELVQTAMQRGCYAHAHNSRVKHQHPLWRTAEWDPTYRKAMEGVDEDRRLYERRRPLWELEHVV